MFRWRTSTRSWVIKYEFLLASHSNYGSILYHFPDKARYWSKIAILHTRAFDAVIRGYPPEYCHNVWYGKARTVLLTAGRKSLMTCVAVSTQYRRVTVRQTDDILRRHSLCLYRAYRSKNPSRFAKDAVKIKVALLIGSRCSCTQRR